MSQNLIFNGFFRSGTTLAYKILKDSNCSKNVFYEPLNRNLQTLCRLENISDFHNADLWSSYDNVSDAVIQNNPGTQKILQHDLNNVKEYFRSLASGEISIFQTNRLHLLIGQFGVLEDYKCVHLIRNPLDVFESFMDGISRRHQKKVILSYAAQAYYSLNRNPFELNEMCYELMETTTKSCSLNIYEKFLLCWVKCNIEPLRSESVFCVSYDDLLHGKVGLLQDHLGSVFRFDFGNQSSAVAKKKNWFAHHRRKRLSSNLLAISQRLQLDYELKELLDFLSLRLKDLK